jgi:hypothetical protein
MIDSIVTEVMTLLMALQSRAQQGLVRRPPAWQPF